MKKSAAILCILLLLTLAASCAKSVGPVTAEVTAEPPVTAEPAPLPVYSPMLPTAEPVNQTEPDEPENPDEQNVPEEKTEFILTFAGDCTLAAEHDYRTADWGFGSVVGKNYEYPFEYASEYMLNDDFTMVNLECALTDYNVPADKLFRFRGDPEYTEILTLGGVECVSIANNHSGDYGETGLSDTKDTLESAGIAYASDGGTCIYTTESGLKIGVCAFFYRFDRMSYAIGSLKEAGVDIIIASCHFGEEGSYRYDSNQEIYAKRAIDYGADIVFGHHPHVLQRVVNYGGGVIYYSLGNFVFGGNSNPRDKDTAIIRQHIIKENGSYKLGETEIIPFALSGSSSYNDYRPIPIEEQSEQYARIISKLDGSFSGPDLYVSYNHPSTEPEEETDIGNEGESSEEPAATEEPEMPEEAEPVTDPEPSSDAGNQTESSGETDVFSSQESVPDVSSD